MAAVCDDDPIARAPVLRLAAVLVAAWAITQGGPVVTVWENSDRAPE